MEGKAAFLDYSARTVNRFIAFFFVETGIWCRVKPLAIAFHYSSHQQTGSQDGRENWIPGDLAH